MRRTYPYVARSFLVAATSFLLLASQRVALAEVESAWIGNASATDWFQSDNWTDGVPRLPGDKASVPFAQASTPAILLNNDVTLGQIQFTGNGVRTVDGTGGIVFDQPGERHAQIDLASAGAGSVVLALPLAVPLGETLNVDVGLFSTLSLEGAVVSSGGDIRKTGLGPLSIVGASASWDGELRIEEGKVVVAADAALGLSGGRTILERGTVLELNRTNRVVEHLVLNDAWLRASGDLDGQLEATGSSRITVYRGSVSLISADIAGAGLLRIDSTGWSDDGPYTTGGEELELLGSLRHFGTLRLEGGGDLSIKGPVEVAGVLQSGGHVAGLDRDGWHDGRRHVQAAVVTDKLIMDGGAVVFWQGGSLQSRGEELLIRRGDLDAGHDAAHGVVSGIKSVRKSTVGVGSINLDALATPAALSIEGGSLLLSMEHQSIAGPVRLDNPKYALLVFNGGHGATYDVDIELNNAAGFRNSGALLSRTSSRLSGTLDLGDEGAYLSGDGRLTLEGPVVGGNLHALGGLVLRSDRLLYRGSTIIKGEMNVAEESSLTATSDVQIGGRGIFSFGNGSTPVNDRIADDIPLAVNGGSVAFVPSIVENRSETLGVVDMTGGISTVSVASTFGVQAELTINELRRAAHSIALFRAGGVNDRLGDDADDSPRIRLAQSPQLANGILGGWALVMAGNDFRHDFASYEAAVGVVPLSRANRPSQIDGAGPEDNVMITENAVGSLAADAAINSLHLDVSNRDPVKVDLAERRLQVQSGGILSTGRGAVTVERGELTAGGDGELFVTALGGDHLTIAAAIVDASPTQAVSLVKSGYQDVFLSGANSYTGPTVVNGVPPGISDSAGSYSGTSRSDLYFLRPEAIPGDHTIILNGGRGILDFDDAALVDLDEIVIRNDGVLRAQDSSLQIVVDAEQYHLESGVLSVRLTGNGDLYKTTDGTVTLSGPHQGFAGRVVITDGVLTGNAGVGPMTIDGGAYVASGTSNVQSIQMLAGSLSSASDIGFRGEIRIEGDVDLLTFSGNYELSRFLDDPAPTRLSFVRDVHVADSVTVTQVGLGEIQLRGNLYVGEGVTVHNRDTQLVDRLYPTGSNRPPDAASFTVPGRIIAAAESASLDLTGPGTFDLAEASYEVGPGKSLTLFRDGVRTTIEIAGSANEITGAGVLGNSVEVGGGGTISPGKFAPGLLTIDGDLSLNTGSRFAVELDGATRGDTFDALDVTGQVWLRDASLSMSWQPGYIPDPSKAYVILKAKQIDGVFANAVDSIRVKNVAFPVTYLRTMVVLGNVAAIPEPGAGTLALLTIGVKACFVRFRQQPKNGS